MFVRAYVLSILVALSIGIACAKVTYTCAIDLNISRPDVKRIRTAINKASDLSIELPLSDIMHIKPVQIASVGRASMSVAHVLDRLILIFELENIVHYNNLTFIDSALRATNTSLNEVNIEVDATFAVIGYFSVNNTYLLIDFREDLARDLNVTLENIIVEKLQTDNQNNLKISVFSNHFAQANYTQNMFVRTEHHISKKPLPEIVATVTTIITSATTKSMQVLFDEKLGDVTITQLTQKVHDNLQLEGFWSMTVNTPFFVSVKFDGQTYIACNGDSVNVTFNGNHNIRETSAAACSDYVGAEIQPYVANANIIFDSNELTASVGQTRYFNCEAHCASRFAIHCPDR